MCHPETRVRGAQNRGRETGKEDQETRKDNPGDLALDRKGDHLTGEEVHSSGGLSDP